VGKLASKQNTVELLKSDLNDATVTLVVDYRGLSVHDLTQIRRELYPEGAKFKIAKNNLVKRVNPDLSALLSGPTALLIGKGDQVTPVKILTSYFKKNKKSNELRGGFLDGKVLSSAEVEQLASLPSVEELRGKLLGAINAPLAGLVSAVSGPQRGLVNVLDQYAKRLQEQAG
jgi:large subunit ribosomal protein L10